MSIERLNELDLSYTPPLASPWNAVQVQRRIGWRLYVSLLAGGKAGDRMC